MMILERLFRRKIVRNARNTPIATANDSKGFQTISSNLAADTNAAIASKVNPAEAVRSAPASPERKSPPNRHGHQ